MVYVQYVLNTSPKIYLTVWGVALSFSSEDSLGWARACLCLVLYFRLSLSLEAVARESGDQRQPDARSASVTESREAVWLL